MELCLALRACGRRAYENPCWKQFLPARVLQRWFVLYSFLVFFKEIRHKKIRYLQTIYNVLSLSLLFSRSHPSFNNDLLWRRISERWQFCLHRVNDGTRSESHCKRRVPFGGRATCLGEEFPGQAQLARWRDWLRQVQLGLACRRNNSLSHSRLARRVRGVRNIPVSKYNYDSNWFSAILEQFWSLPNVNSSMTTLFRLTWPQSAASRQL